MQIVIFGLSITSSWGNGHATTYRGLVRELAARGHDVTFLERDMPWYASNRDMPKPPYGHTHLYRDLNDLAQRFGGLTAGADAVIVGSYVPQGVEVATWALDRARGRTAFYDIDTPVTLAKLARGDYEYLAPELIPRFDLYLSFTGGPVLDELEERWGAQDARPLYCSVDPELYYPEDLPLEWDLGYLGTYSADRQPPIERLLLKNARAGRGRFVVAGPLYPATIAWPANVQRIDHLPPSRHRAFYNAQRFTLNVTRADMVRTGFAPSVRLFEAAACAVPVISDYWEGLGRFFRPGHEILAAHTTAEVRDYLWDLPDDRRREIGRAAREMVLKNHTAARRAEELEQYLATRYAPAS
jgi:spore maturation protein CgeB